MFNVVIVLVTVPLFQTGSYLDVYLTNPVVVIVVEYVLTPLPQLQHLQVGLLPVFVTAILWAGGIVLSQITVHWVMYQILNIVLPTHRTKSL